MYMYLREEEKIRQIQFVKLLIMLSPPPCGSIVLRPMSPSAVCSQIPSIGLSTKKFLFHLILYDLLWTHFRLIKCCPQDTIPCYPRRYTNFPPYQTLPGRGRTPPTHATPCWRNEGAGQCRSLRSAALRDASRVSAPRWGTHQEFPRRQTLSHRHTGRSQMICAII
jgi:hypothetical protein